MVHFIPNFFGPQAPHEGAPVHPTSFAKNISTIALGGLAFFSANLIERTNPGLAAVIRCVVGGAGLVWLFNKCCPSNGAVGAAHHHHHHVSPGYDNPLATPMPHHKYHQQPTGFWNKYSVKNMWQAPYTRFFGPSPVGVQQPLYKETQYHQQAKTTYTASPAANFPNMMKVNQAVGGFSQQSPYELHEAPFNHGPKVQSGYSQHNYPSQAKTNYSQGANIMGSGAQYSKTDYVSPQIPQSKYTAPPNLGSFPDVNVHQSMQGNQAGNSRQMFQAAKTRDN